MLHTRKHRSPEFVLMPASHMKALIKGRAVTDTCPHTEEIKKIGHGKIMCAKRQHEVKIRKCVCCNAYCNRRI